MNYSSCIFPFKKILLSVSKLIKEILNWQLLHTRCCPSKMICHLQLKRKTLQNPLESGRKNSFSFTSYILQRYLKGSKGQNCYLQNYIQNRQGNISTSYLMNFNENKFV